MWEISKTFEFCYGHRVHTQVLDGRYAADLKCACRHLHGHEGKLIVTLTTSKKVIHKLNDSGMITDFRHLEWFKKWLNEYVDHHFILDMFDPLYKQLIGDKELIPVTIEGYLAGYILNTSNMVESPEKEYYDGFFVVNFVPTSEMLSSWAANVVNAKMKALNVRVSKIDWFETPKSVSTFICD